MATNAVLEFLEFIEHPPHHTVRELMERVLLKSRKLTGAQAGSVFLVRAKGEERWLEATSIQNDAIALHTDSFTIPLDRRSIAGHVALSGETVLIDDLYKLPANAPYHFDHSFDQQTGFRSRSMLAFALMNHQGRVIGVVQLINRHDPKSGEITAFSDDQMALIAPFNHFVGSVVERADMIEQIKQKNTVLRTRNRELRNQRSQIAALQEETEDAFMLSIRLLARAAELHDEGTGKHIERVNEYSHLLAQKCDLPTEFCETIRYSAQLHDVGKMSINQALLLKRGGLTDEERKEMNLHTYYGHRILVDSDRLTMGAEIAYAHHERWDGLGYPRGLKGEEIPLAARIVSLADIYDALRSERSYKPGFTHERTVHIMTKGDDRIDPVAHFDPALSQLFAAYHGEFGQIWSNFYN